MNTMSPVTSTGVLTYCQNGYCDKRKKRIPPEKNQKDAPTKKKLHNQKKTNDTPTKKN